MTKDEIEREAQAQLDAISPEKLTAFFNRLDSDEDTPNVAISTEQATALNTALAALVKTGYTVTAVPTLDDESLQKMIRKVAEQFVAQSPEEDVDDIERQLQRVSTDATYRSGMKKVEDDVSRVAKAHGAMPNPFKVACADVNAARREADCGIVSREPIAILPLVCDLLMIQASVPCSVPLTLHGGKKKVMNLTFRHPVAKSKRNLIDDLNDFMLANAVLAKSFDAHAVELWKRAIDYLWRKSFQGEQGQFTLDGVARGWTKKETAELVTLIDKARTETHIATLIYDYQVNKKEVSA